MRAGIVALLIVLLLPAGVMYAQSWHGSFELLAQPGLGTSTISQISVGIGLEDERSQLHIGLTAKSSLLKLGQLNAFQRLSAHEGFGGQLYASYQKEDEVAEGRINIFPSFAGGHFRELDLVTRVDSAQLEFSGFYRFTEEMEPIENVQWASFGLYRMHSPELSSYFAIHGREHVTRTSELVLFGPLARVSYRQFFVTGRVLTEDGSHWRPAVSVGASVDL